MKKTFFNVKIATIVQFVLCLIFAFAIWISVKYSDMYSDDNNPSADEETAEASAQVNLIEV